MAPNERAPRRSTLANRRARADRDGDVKMGIEPKPTRGRVGKPEKPPTGPAAARAGKDGQPPRGPRAGLNHRNILRAAARGDPAIKESTRAPKSGLAEFKVTGWEKSAASHANDSGVSSLLQWLETKVSRKLGTVKRTIKFKKFRVEGSTLYISVPETDARVVERMNGFSWAKTTLHIERVGGSEKGISSHAEEVKAMLQSVLESRYDESNKLLNLSALAQDPQLKAQAIFDSTSTAGKFFPALMRVLEQAFDKPDERDAAIKSVSLANNDLPDLKAVSTLSFTLPKLENLDLSNNQFSKLESLENWKRRFPQLQHLVLSGNPIEQNEPNYGPEIVKWYPKLRVLNQTQVRTEEDIANKANVTDIPFAVKSPKFQDEGGIVENFVKTFFQGFDTNRPALAELYYDEQSSFSMSVNTSAPRDPKTSAESGKGEWESYIKHSRNIKRLGQLGARHTRLARGPKAVAEVLMSMPASKHPDLMAEPRKWMIESHIQPGIPDPTGQSPGGVDGFSVNIHGEYDEIDPQTNQPGKKRSFDHSIQLGPALPGSSSVVRIVSHMMTVRMYGGAQAFDPDTFADNRAPTPPQESLPVPELPAGLTIPMAEQLLAEFSKATGMTVAYTKMCLDGCGWDVAKAQGVFENVKATLPAEAFLQQQ